MKPLPTGEYKELTPADEACTFGPSCPGVFVLEDLTPFDSQCSIGPSCPTVLRDSDGKYYLIGTTVDVRGTEFEARVGAGETMIELDAALLEGALKAALEGKRP